MAALRLAKESGFLATLTLCNVATSATVRESDLAMMLNAGTEVGVASTKAFVAQTTALMLVTLLLARHHGLSRDFETEIVQELHRLPAIIKDLALDDAIAALAKRFANKEHALYLGRGSFYPIALEGALKLKELSYIHAEGYAAGELKHGPLALVDESMPVVAIAPNDELLEKPIQIFRRCAPGVASFMCLLKRALIHRLRKALPTLACRSATNTLLLSPTWCRYSCWLITSPLSRARM